MTAILIPRASVITLTFLGLSVLAISIGKRRAPPLPSRLLIGVLASILLLSTLGFFWSVAPEEILRRLPRITILFLWGLLALATVQKATPQIAENAMNLMALVLTIALIVIAIEINFDYTIYRTLIAIFTQSTEPVNINSNFINRPAVLVALYLWPVSLALWLKGLRILAIAFIGLTLVVFIPSSSQSAVLALICGTFACGLTALFPRLMKIGFSLTIVGFMAAMLAIPQFLQSLFRGYEEIIPASGLHRLEIWKFVAGKIFEQPFSGYGLEASRAIGNNTNSFQSSGNRLSFLHPHNGFLQTWLELGLAGYLVLGFLCLWIVHRISLLKGARKAFSAGMLACALSIFATAFGMWQGWLVATQFSAAGALLLCFMLVDKTVDQDSEIL